VKRFRILAFVLAAILVVQMQPWYVREAMSDILTAIPPIEDGAGDISGNYAELIENYEETMPANVPSVTNAVTAEDTQSTSGLMITRNAQDNSAITHYKITGITGGTLYKENGITPISNNNYITAAEGAAGLRFTPDTDTNTPAGGTYSFQVQAALNSAGTGLSAEATASITVYEVNDAPVAVGDTLSAVETNSGARSIPFATLLANDSPGPANESGQTLTITSIGSAVGGTAVIQGTDVIFTPDPDYTGVASFLYTVMDNGTTNGMPDPRSAQAFVTFTINQVAHVPSVTNAVTAEDTQSASGLMITRNAQDNSAITHYKITGITGGTLYKQNGITPISNNDYITAAEGAAGLRFTPATDANTPAGGTFFFQVQAALDSAGTGLSAAATASITVTEVNDPPVAHDDTLLKAAKASGKRIIPFAELIHNDVPGPSNESTQSLTIIQVAPVTGGTVAIDNLNGHVEFELDRTFTGMAKFTYTVQDNGTTGEVNDFKTAQAEVSFEVKDETKPVITLLGDNPMYLLVGESYVEPGYSADDDADLDLTADVTVQGNVDTQTMGSYTLSYLVADLSGNEADEVVRTVYVVSNRLHDLTVGRKGMQPAFDPDKTAYTLKVPDGVSFLTLTADAQDPTATLTIDEEAKGNGGAKRVKLRPGKNSFAIVVTPQGGASQTYTIEVTLASAPSAEKGTGTTPGKRTAMVVIDDGKDKGLVQVEIGRSIREDGKIVDSVVIDGSTADVVARLAAANGTREVKIAYRDIPEMPADIVDVTVSREALGKWKSAGLRLDIDVNGVIISLTKETLSSLSDGGQDLLFHVAPIRQGSATHDTVTQAIQSQEMKDYAHGQSIEIIGQPMTIETNYVNHRTKVTLPLKVNDFPTGPEKRAALLNGLAVFVDHGKGEKVVQKGNIVYDTAGNPVGIEIEIEKFSTFVVVSVGQTADIYPHYIMGYEDGNFRPDANITRAELTSMMSRLLGTKASAGVKATSFPDVDDAYWAAGSIRSMHGLGIFEGDSNGNFRPESPVTRAEMAVIIAKLKGLQVGVATDGSHWASATVEAVKKAGLMVGYADGTFGEERALTRAEAVVLFNRLFDRPVPNVAQQPAWLDVPASYWAYLQIESASNDLRLISGGLIEIK